VDRLMALVLLRWRTGLRAFSRARERVVGLVLMVPGLLLFSGMGSIVAFVGVRSLEARHPAAVLPFLSTAATAVGIFWALSPILAGVAFTESHDMSRLLHFPIPLPTLVASSLIANLAQPMVLAEMPILFFLALGLSTQAVFFPAVLAGVLLTFAFVLAGGQVCGLLMHGLSRNRRLQDLALFLGLGLGFLVSWVPLMALSLGGRWVVPLGRLILGTDLFAASPWAWGVRAAAYAGRGEVLPFVGFAVAGLGGILAAATFSTVLIHRIYQGELDLGVARSASAAGSRMILGGPLGALLEKDVRAAWREPAFKATLIMGLIGPVVFFLFMAQTSMYGRSGTAMLVLASLLGLSSFGANAFGLERRGIVLLMGFPVERWKILVGKNLAAVMFRIPGLLTLGLAALVLATPEYLPAAMTIVIVTLLISASIDNYASILFPVAVPPPGGNPYGGARSGTRGLGGAFVGALLLFGALLCTSPFVLLVWLPLLLEMPWLSALSLPLALAGAGSVYAMLVAGAARLLQRREPELLERILGEV